MPRPKPRHGGFRASNPGGRPKNKIPSVRVSVPGDVWASIDKMGWDKLRNLLALRKRLIEGDTGNDQK